MKKIIGGCLLASLVLLGGCESQPKINEADLLTQLEDIELDINGVYYSFTTNGREQETPQTFTGRFQEIQNLVVEPPQAENIIKVTFDTPIGNEFYQLSDSQMVQATFTVDDEKKVTLQSTEIITEEPLLVEPTYPLDVEYLLEQDSEVLISIPKEQYSENLGLDLNNNQAPKGWKEYWFNVPLSKETVEDVSLELIEDSYASLFRIFSPKLVITFKNGLKIESNSEIFYSPNTKSDNPADHWNFNILRNVTYHVK